MKRSSIATCIRFEPKSRRAFRSGHLLSSLTVLLAVLLIGQDVSAEPARRGHLLIIGGGLRTDRWVNFNHASHNDLLVAIANLCGDPRTSFGDPSRGAITLVASCPSGL